MDRAQSVQSAERATEHLKATAGRYRDISEQPDPTWRDWDDGRVTRDRVNPLEMRADIPVQAGPRLLVEGAELPDDPVVEAPQPPLLEVQQSRAPVTEDTVPPVPGGNVVDMD